MSDTEDQDKLAEEWAKTMEEGGAEQPDMDDMFEQAPMEDFEDTSEELSDAEKEKLDMVLDLPVTISLEVGRSKISIRNLLQLNQGSVVELDRIAGESLDVLVNGTLIAHGEVVVVNDLFGIRLTDVISQTERIKKLK